MSILPSIVTAVTEASRFPAAAPPPNVGIGAMVMLVLFIAGSIWIGVTANRVTRKGGFMKGFFLGNRGLGAWALALTATIQSGGTFMGFPSLVYSHGWIVALWIGSYMVVPITGFGILGKRLAQLSRRTGAITVPDLFRSRFNSPALGLTCTIFILMYLSFLMFAQFKAGAIVLQIAWPSSESLTLSEDVVPVTDVVFSLRLGSLATNITRYHVGLIIFTLAVVSYTLMGGFLAAVWTDLFQSLLMFVGVSLLLVASLNAAGGLEKATRASLANTGPGFVSGPGYTMPKKTEAAKADVSTSSAVAPQAATSVTPHEFLPLSLAISFFVIWVWGGVGAPAGLVRLMASQDTRVIRKSICLLSLYNMGIYLPLIVICICGRALIPDLDSTGQTDQIIPRLAILTTKDWPGGSFVAGLILAAPFGAVLATVSSYLVVLSSAVVRDIYQRIVNPNADRRHLRWAARLAMVAAGLISVIVSWYPVNYLQVFIVFSTSGAASTFLVPAIMACYWRKATAAGIFVSMFSGAMTVLALYLIGIFGWLPAQATGAVTPFRPYYLGGMDPMIWGVLASATFGIVVSCLTEPPAEELVATCFDVAA